MGFTATTHGAAAVADLNVLRLGPQCLFHFDIATEMLAIGIVPVAFLVSSALFFFFGALLIHWWKKKNVPMSIVVGWLSALQFEALLVFSFLCLPSVSQKIFEYLAPCTTIDYTKCGAQPQRFLPTDWSLDCDSPRYSQYMDAAIILLLLYPVGVPLLYSVLLCHSRKRLNGELQSGTTAKEIIESRNADPRVQHLSFLVISYKPSCWWYEVVETVRKLLLTSCVILLGTNGDSTNRVLYAIVVQLAALAHLHLMMPYINPRLNTLALMSNWALFALLFVVLLLKIEALVAISSSEKFMLDGLLIGCMALCVGLTLWMVIAHMSRRLAGKLWDQTKRKKPTKTSRRPKTSGTEASGTEASGLEMKSFPDTTHWTVNPHAETVM
jgi:hypothetical protein